MVNMNLQSSLEFDRELLKMSLKESGEVFEPVKIVPGLSMVNQPAKVWFLRRSVKNALEKAAAEFYHHGLILEIQDAYRSLAVQKQKFLDYLSNVKVREPRLKVSEMKKRANTFVAGIPILAAHTAGAAVDVILKDKSDVVVDMGSGYLEFGEKAITQFQNISNDALVNRKLLVSVMEKSGFANYPFEFWHYSLGDVCDCYLNQKSPAVYGPVEFDQETQKITYPISGHKLYTYF
jgi:D-alanyl-D-alanine dipeptidase